MKTKYYSEWVIVVPVTIKLRAKLNCSNRWRQKLEREAAQTLHVDVGGCSIDNGCYGYKSTRAKRKIAHKG